MIRALPLLMALLLPSPGNAADFELSSDLEVKVSCERFYKDLNITGPTIPHRTLDVAEMSSTDHFPLHAQAAYDPKAAYIGVSNGNDAKEGSHHYY
ncbi:MAG: hypothetical protein EOP11_26275, partial [Proteobacteria bacterium]